jgi:hypothetical protein
MLCKTCGLGIYPTLQKMKYLDHTRKQFSASCNESALVASHTSVFPDNLKCNNIRKHKLSPTSLDRGTSIVVVSNHINHVIRWIQRHSKLTRCRHTEIFSVGPHLESNQYTKNQLLWMPTNNLRCSSIKSLCLSTSPAFALIIQI